MMLLQKQSKEFLWDLFFPSKCLYCGKRIPAEQYACPACEQAVPKGKEARLAPCEFLDKTSAALRYDAAVPKGIAEFKFHGQFRLAEYFAEQIAQNLELDFFENRTDCCISWVPMHPARERKRGYNQAKLLAECLARQTGIPCECLLRKVRNNHIQHSLAYSQRKENVKHTYATVKGKALRGRAVLLVDDILTSGATINECARVLKEAGVSSVYGAVIASAASCAQ